MTAVECEELCRKNGWPVLPDGPTWFWSGGESLYSHKDSVDCGFYYGPWVNRRTVLTWDSVTCPDCRKLKQDWEPETQYIDTRGD